MHFETEFDDEKKNYLKNWEDERISTMPTNVFLLNREQQKRSKNCFSPSDLLKWKRS